MAHLVDIRAELAARLAPIARANGGHATAYWTPDSPHPPVLQVLGPGADGIDYLTGAFGSDDTTWSISVQGLVGTVSDRAAQERLDRWLSSNGPDSVREALEADQKIPGVWWGVVVERATGYEVYEFDGGTRLLGAIWTVRVETEA